MQRIVWQMICPFNFNELTEVREEFEATQVLKRFFTMAADSFSCNFRLLKAHRFIPDQIPASKIRDFCMQANAP
jgi:hypothetical protein